MRMGVVADNITGANDIGVVFAKWGYLVHVYAYEREGDFEDAHRTAVSGPESAPDIVILDTNSRLDSAGVAAGKVSAAARELRAAGCRQYHNKTCSVFRGSIGAEFDAMLDALGLDFAVVVLGFPKNGRTTVDGIHYVHGVRLEESEFRRDPIHPMTRSDLVGILQAQTPRRVSLIDHSRIEQGAPSLRDDIAQARAAGGYVILDVTGQPALRTIAAAIYDEPVICGSSAIAEELPEHWGPRARPLPPPAIAAARRHGVLCVAGSLMPQTAAQVAYLEERGVAVLELDGQRLFRPADREAGIQQDTEKAASLLFEGRDVLIQAPSDPAQVAATHAAGAECGLESTETARTVSSTLAEAAGRIVARADISRVAVAGVETSAAVCERLGVREMRIWQEIQPGLPSCISLPSAGHDDGLLLVLKSGSFGSPAFLSEALDHLKRFAGEHGQEATATDAKG